MASVTGSVLAFSAPNDRPVNVILSDGSNVAGSTVPGAFNIEIFTAGTGSLLPGVDASATIGGAVKISGSVVQAGSLSSTEQLGAGRFTVIDETGHEEITLGSGAQTVIGSSGDTLVGGNAGAAQQVIDLTGANTSAIIPGPMTAIGGAGLLLVEAGTNDSISGGSGPMTVTGGSFDTISGGSGPIVIGGTQPFHHDEEEEDGTGRDDGEDHDDHNRGRGGGDDNQHHDRDDQGAGQILPNHDSIIGGSGPMSVLGGTADTIQGGSGSLFVDGVTASMIIAGTGGTTVFGGNNDTISDSSSGTLLVDIESRDRAHGHSPSVPGSGAETVSLGLGHGATTLRDISVPGGSGSPAMTSIMGFNTLTDSIASKSSVSRSGEFLGTATVSAGNTVMTFRDGATMTLVGITDITSVHFVR